MLRILQRHRVSTGQINVHYKLLRLITNSKNVYHRNTWYEDMQLFFRKKALLFKAAMIHRRVLHFDFGFGGSSSSSSITNSSRSGSNYHNNNNNSSSGSNSSRGHKHVFSLSDVAGHCSFLFLALMYLESDILNLRFFAVSGIVSSIVFQYYREKPLWIPIRWNALFLSINCVMTAILLKDQHDVQHIPQDQMQLFETVFQRKGMKPVDFMHLIHIAKRIEFKKGDKLVAGDKKNTRVYLVKSGRLGTYKDGVKVAEIKNNQFVGSVSYKSWEGKVDVVKQRKKTLLHMYNSWNSSSNDLTDAFNPMFLLYEAAEVAALRGLGEAPHQHMRAATTTACAADAALDATTAAVETATAVLDERQRALLDISCSTGSRSGYNTGNNTDDNSNESCTSQQQAQYQAQQPSATVTATVGEVDGDDGHADVICLEDCVVFSWSFNKLRDLMTNYPSLGFAFERCLSEDLGNKMSLVVSDEPRQRYETMLTGAIMDGETTEKSKRMLETFRKKHNIRYSSHLKILEEHQWTENDFEAGYQGAPSADTLEEYFKLLQQALEAPKGLSWTARQQLRDFRVTNSIRGETHVEALRRLNWTIDDYEIGKKASPPQQQQQQQQQQK